MDKLFGFPAKRDGDIVYVDIEESKVSNDKEWPILKPGKGGLKKGELFMVSSGGCTGRFIVAEHAAACADAELTPEQIEVLGNHDIMELDFSEIEMRVLAHMREDAEKMDDTDEFRRPEDLKGYDTAKVRTLLSLKDAEKILNEEGCQTVDIHKIRAAELFDVAEDDVTDEQRRFAKVFNFRDMYDGNNNTICDLIDQALARSKRQLNES